MINRTRYRIQLGPVAGLLARTYSHGAHFRKPLEAYENGEYAGLGFVFSSADPFTGIDMDDCVDADGEIAQWALEIARYFESYTEISATGTGLHIIVRGEIPNRRKGDVEVYSSKRFFTVTGHAVEVSGD